MSDDIGKIKSVQPLSNINHLTAIDRDRQRRSKNFHKKQQDTNQQLPEKEQQDSAVSSEAATDLSDGHSIDVRA